MRLVHVWTVMLAAAALAWTSQASQREGVEEKPVPRDHIVKVELGSPDNQMRFFPGRIVLKKGERYMLFLSNPSPVTHEFASEAFSSHIETEKLKVFSQEGDLVAYVVGNIVEVELLPGGYIQWFFTAKSAAPRIDLFCDIPGHFDAGMIGEIEIRDGR